MNNSDKNTYCIFDDFLVFQGRYGKSAMHSHHYMQFGVSRSDVFKLQSPDWREEQVLASFFVPPDVTHQVHLSGEEQVLMIWVDPDQYNNFSLSNNSIQYPVKQLEQLEKVLKDGRLDCQKAKKVRQAIVGNQMKKEEMDTRISDSISWIKENLTEQTITVEQLANAVYLSKSRFMHLFSEQVGIPARKYILWQRLRYALVKLSEGGNITESAHRAGFTDASHMNRNFNKMFGITPSKIFKNSRFIQVFTC